MSKNKNLIIVLFLFAVVLVSYANIFRNEFVWDDEFFIEENIKIRDFGNIPKFFTEPSTGNLYRPLRSVFYTINYQIWKHNAFGYHLNSFLLHLSVTILFFFITLKITDKITFSFVASLFFAAHPVHTERITNMTAAFDAFGILFLLLSFFFYIIFSKENKKYGYLVSIVFYLLAIFSSEEAITLILILILYDFSFNHKINLENFKLLLKKYIPYIIITIFYLLIRFSILRQIGRTGIYFEQSFFGTALATTKIFVEYIVLLFLPINLTTEHVVKFETSLLSIGFIVSLLVLLLIFFFFIKSYKKSKILFFSIGWFFVTLLPFSNLVPTFNLMAERYLYLPSYGFCLFLACLMFKMNNIGYKKFSKAITIILIVLITSAYIILTIQRNAEWKDNFTLLTTSIERSPLGTRSHHTLALYYREKGDYETATKYALRAVELASKNYNAYENLGTIKAYQKKYDEAIYYYNKSLELEPNFYLAINNLGLVYGYIGDFNSSLFYLKKAIQTNPELSKAYNDIGTVYANIGKFDKAIGEINRAIEINHYNADYYYNLAIIYEYLKDKEKAKYLLIKGLEIEPDNNKVNNKLRSLEDV